MITGNKFIVEDLIYTNFKKHFCPMCEIKLERIKCSKIVNSRSAEAENFDFSLGDVYLKGNIKFSWDRILLSAM